MSKNNSVDAKPLKILLERVCLGGMIEECVLHVEEGYGHVSAVDMTNTVLLSVSEKIDGLEDGEFGLSQLPMLVKFLSSCEDGKVSYAISGDNKWITLKRKKHGKLKALLLETDLVGTKLEHAPDMQSLINDYPCRATLTRDFMDRALYYIGLVGGQSVMFTVNSAGTVMFQSSSTKTSQFEMLVGKNKSKSEDELSVVLYSDQVRSVLNVVEPSNDSNIHLRPNYPVIIEQDGHNAWALTPIEV